MNSVQMTLNQKFIELKKKNPRLSTRFFAQKIGVSSGALSEILAGKRKISKKLAEKISDRLQMSPQERQLFLAQFSDDNEIIDFNYLQLRNDQFHLISEWPHFAILNLVKSKNCIHKVDWFAAQLNLSERAVHACMDRLLRLGLLKFEQKKYIRTTANTNTTDDVLNLSIQKSIREDLDMIREHLDFLQVHERDLTSMTLLLDPQKMPDFKKWLRQAQDRFAGKFETTDSEVAFRLTMALFPLKKPHRQSP